MMRIFAVYLSPRTKRINNFTYTMLFFLNEEMGPSNLGSDPDSAEERNAGCRKQILDPLKSMGGLPIAPMGTESGLRSCTFLS